MILKYKAWHITKKIIVDVLRIDLEDAKIKYNHNGSVYTDTDHQENLIILPYTNVKDSKGTEIFLGDLISIAHYNNKEIALKDVTFCDGVFGVKTFAKFVSLHEIINDKRYTIKVIGSVYEQ